MSGSCVARLAALALPAALAVGACAPGTSPSGTLTASAPARTDTTWFISARGRSNGRDRRTLADSLLYGVAIHAARAASDARNAPLADPELVLVDSLVLTRDAFVAALRARVDAQPAPEDYAVLYVHGYGTGLHEGWAHAAVSRRRTRADAPWVIFSWPSNGTGIDWPSFGALVERAYLDDSAAAKASIPLFEEAARAVVAAVGGRRTLLVTHSLGVQLAGEALAARPALRQLLGADPLRAVAYVAPDVERRRFGDYLVPATLPLAHRVLLYASARDRVLSLSRQLHGSERAGLVRGTPLTRPGLETVETTLGERAIGRARRFVDTHHAISRAAATLFDLAHVVGAQRSPTCRAALGTATATTHGGTWWRLASSALPPLADLARCAPSAPPSR